MSEEQSIIALPPGEGNDVDLGSIRITFKAAGSDTGGRLTVAEYVGAPGSGAAPHVHHHEDESFYILEGAMTFQLGEDVFAAAAGSFVLIPRGTRHAFANEAAEPVRAIMTFSPAGLEHYFEELSALLRTPDGPSEDEVAALNRRYHLDFG